MIRKLFSIISVLAICIGILSGSLSTGYAEGNSELDKLPSKHMVLMDYSSGKILYQKNAHTKIYPASTTKIWTAFCVLKKCKNLNEEVEIKKIPSIEGSSMYLENGEKFTVYQLLESMLIHSSNDVAYILAQHFGDGNASNFINFMNEEAAKYGAVNTHFNNPHGLPDTNHYTTAMDLTNLARVAYGNSTIKKIVAMKEVSFKKGPHTKIARHLFNSNKFLTGTQLIQYRGKDIPIKYDIVDGIKTGFTDDAGNCLVSTAKKNGIRLIAGVFNAPSGSLYHDSRALLDYGFNNFKNIVILKKQDYNGEKSINFAIPGSINYSLASDFVVTLPKDKKIDRKAYTTKYNFNNLKLPIKKGDIIGTLNVFEDGNMISCIGLVAESNSQSWTSYIKSKIPFLNDDKKENTHSKKEGNSATTSDNKTEKNEDENKESNNKTEKNEDKTKNSEQNTDNQGDKKEIGILDRVKNFFSDVKNFFKTYFNKDFVANVEKTDFYKYLDTTISSYQKIIPSKYIIFGVPIFILIIIFLLIIGIIKDNFVHKRRAKKEMKVSDIVTKNDDDKK